MSDFTVTTCSVNPASIIAAWSDRADELAVWANARLVVRSDCYGAYAPIERRGKTYTRRDGSSAKVPKSFTAKNAVTLDLLARHFRGARPEHVIGLHSTSTTNTSLAVRVDIDAHGPGGNDPACNLKAALAWYDKLHRFGFHPLLNGSNGAGGYHLTALFTELVPTSLVFGFLRWLTDDHCAARSFGSAGEVPQAGVHPCRRVRQLVAFTGPTSYEFLLLRSLERQPVAGRRRSRVAPSFLGRR